MQFISWSNILKSLLLSSGLALLAVSSVRAESRAEHCVDFGPGQFFDAMSTCVTSVLPPQGHNRYGPGQLSSNGGAWCEGAPGDGLHQEIRFYFSNAASPRRFSIRNGYVKSAKAYRRNGRVAVLRMSDDAGHVTDVFLEDTPNEQTIAVPWNRADVTWFQFEIRDVYRGKKYRDTCISLFMPDFEGE